MDNFKRSKPQQSQKPSSVDGFIRRGRTSARSAYDRNRTLRTQAAATSSPAFQTSKSMSSNGVDYAPPIHGKPVGRRQTRAEEDIKLNLPPAEKRERAGARAKKGIFKKSLSTLLMIFLIGGGYLFGKGYVSILNVFGGGGNAAALQENVDPSQLRGEGDGRVNVLLLGRGGEGHEGADLTDTIIVASIDPVNKKAALLSIPRDLWVQPDSYGAMKINSVFAAGKNMASEGQNPDEEGVKLLEQTLEDVIGIPMHYHAMIDFEGFKQAIDTIGGVTVDVPEELAVYESYYESSFVLDVEAGLNTFDGETALAFSRSRKTSPRGDFDRSGRQRLVMLALKDKVLSMGTFGNPVKINELLGNFGSHISSNLSTNEVLRLYEIAEEIQNSEVASVGLADEPNSLVTTDNINGLSVVVPKAGVYDYSAIRYFVRNALRDGFLSNEDATVAVYNGTDIGGLAGRTGDELKSFGYNVSVVADSPEKGQVTTTLVDLTNGEKKYTKAYLEKRFGVTAVNSVPMFGIEPGDADFVIILGTNEESRLDS